MATKRQTMAQRVTTTGKVGLLLCAGLLAGCASSGDLEQIRQDARQGESALRTDLMKEQAEFSTLAKENDELRAAHDKISQSVMEYMKAEEARHVTALEQVRAAMKATSGAPFGPGTTLMVTNLTSTPVPVLVTLGSRTPPFCITNVSQLGWGIAPLSGSNNLKGTFTLPANGSVSFNSKNACPKPNYSFSGNIAFGSTFTSQGCGGCNNPYPNATNLAEFTLNMPGETVDISDVNGVNALITINFSGGSNWNNGGGGNQNVTTIANQPITTWNSPSGVFGWQATDCVDVKGTPPNPMNNCPAPVDAPSGPQLQPNRQCNIQRASLPTGGTVQIVFNGFISPQKPCDK